MPIHLVLVSMLILGVRLGVDQPLPDVPAPLAAMVDAEREFAASARVLGVRDAFLKFLAADAVMFVPDPVVAHEDLATRPSVPFAEEPLIWEPRLGDVAASGELGWLIGPSASAAANSTDANARHAVYLSVWKRQPDGAWRVSVDVGVGAPAEPAFAPGFNRFPLGERWRPDASRSAAEPLADADRALNGALTQRGLRDGYSPFLADATSLLRAGMMPVVGRRAILESVATKPERYAGSLTRVESSQSGDLGFSYGTYTLAGTTPESGMYLRIWQRDAAGAWRLSVDLARGRPTTQQEE